MLLFNNWIINHQILQQQQMDARGEGYVVGRDVKLVNRAGFSAQTQERT